MAGDRLCANIDECCMRIVKQTEDQVYTYCNMNATELFTAALFMGHMTLKILEI